MAVPLSVTLLQQRFFFPEKEKTKKKKDSDSEIILQKEEAVTVLNCENLEVWCDSHAEEVKISGRYSQDSEE